MSIAAKVRYSTSARMDVVAMYIQRKFLFKLYHAVRGMVYYCQYVGERDNRDIRVVPSPALAGPHHFHRPFQLLCRDDSLLPPPGVSYLLEVFEPDTVHQSHHRLAPRINARRLYSCDKLGGRCRAFSSDELHNSVYQIYHKLKPD